MRLWETRWYPSNWTGYSIPYEASKDISKDQIYDALKLLVIEHGDVSVCTDSSGHGQGASCDLYLYGNNVTGKRDLIPLVELYEKINFVFFEYWQVQDHEFEGELSLDFFLDESGELVAHQDIYASTDFYWGEWSSDPLIKMGSPSLLDLIKYDGLDEDTQEQWDKLMTMHCIQVSVTHSSKAELSVSTLIKNKKGTRIASPGNQILRLANDLESHINAYAIQSKEVLSASYERYNYEATFDTYNNEVDRSEYYFTVSDKWTSQRLRQVFS